MEESEGKFVVARDEYEAKGNDDENEKFDESDSHFGRTESQFRHCIKNSWHNF